MQNRQTEFFLRNLKKNVDTKTFLLYNIGVLSERTTKHSPTGQKGRVFMKKAEKITVKQYLSERPSVHIGMDWDAEGWMFVISNTHEVYALIVKRSEVMDVLNRLTVYGEDCSEKSGGGWHLRVNGSTAAFRWAMAKTGGECEVKGRLERLCSESEFKAYVKQYQTEHGEAAPNMGRTAEWLCGEHFEGSTLCQKNDRKNDGTSDIVLADGRAYEIKCIALTSRAQIKVQD